MYQQVRLAVRQAGEVGETFEAQRGVKQGDPLSPLLFGLLIDRLEQRLLQKYPHIGARILDSLVSLLLYADDLVLIAETPAHLQTLLDELQSFCLDFGLTVNVRKSESLTFNPSSPPPTFRYNDQPLPDSDSFLYLGMLFDAKHGLKSAWQRNLEKGTRASYLVTRRSNTLNIHTPSTRLLFFNTYAAPILSYGCEVWGPPALSLINKKNSPRALADRLQLSFIKHTLGVPPQATTAALWMELGFTRVSTTWLQRCIDFHNAVLARPDPADLLRLALTENKSLAQNGTRCWSFYLDKVLRKLAVPSHSLSLSPLDALAATAAYDAAWIDPLKAKPSRLPSHLSIRQIPDSCLRRF